MMNTRVNAFRFEARVDILHTTILFLITFVIAMTSVRSMAQTPPTPVAGQTNIPLTPVMISPVQKFRELLAMTPEARIQSLSNRPPEIRLRVLAKLTEYEALPAHERELRLEQTHLRWLLLALVNLTPDQRSAQLSLLTGEDRQLITPRLAQWDQLPADVQHQVLEYEHAIGQISKGTQPVPNTNSTSPPEPPAPPTVLVNFLKLPLEQRKEIFVNFQKFFRLSDFEKQKTLATMHGSQREKTELAFASLKGLTDEKQREILEQVRSFSEMSESARREFLHNSERWRALTAVERQAWRQLMNRSKPLPPMPPGIALPPPMPTAMATQP